jgi:hypothetical protein
MTDHKIPIHEGVAIVDAWLDHHFPGDQRAYLPREGNRPHLWRVQPGSGGPGFRLAVREDVLQRSGMLADRLAAVARGTSVQAAGDWVVLSTRGIERRL